MSDFQARERKTRSCNGLVEEFDGATPELGRVFRPEESKPGAPEVVILSHGLWQRSYGGRPDILGERLTSPRTLHRLQLGFKALPTIMERLRSRPIVIFSTDSFVFGSTEISITERPGMFGGGRPLSNVGHPEETGLPLRHARCPIRHARGSRPLLKGILACQD